MQYPKKLKPGGTIGLVCPSSAISSEREKQCIKVIQEMGYSVATADNLSTDYAGYMAGDGKTRGQWMNRMFADPAIDAIFCVRGGFGSSRMMDYLDLDMIQKNPKIFVGYSDITLLHLAFNQICQFVTFHGPMVSSNMVEHFDSETRESFFNAIQADSNYTYYNPKNFALASLKKGKAEGILTGGNLSLLSSSVGTPYEVDTKDKILFIEEVEESISRIERFAYHLRNSGKLKECAGILLGQFTDCNNDGQPSYDVYQCFSDILEGIDIPVICNIQSGHSYPMTTLPMGAHCSIDADSLTIGFEAP